MKKFYIVFIPIACFLISCSQKTANKKNLLAESRESEYADEKENFYAFLNDFSNEELFQRERVKFPIAVITPNPEHEGMAPKTDTIGKYDWEPLDLNYDSTFATREYDRYYQTVVFRKDTAIVEVRGIDNGIYADYYFKLFDNKWYLVTLQEASF